MLPQTEVVKWRAIKAEESEIAKRLEQLAACEAERAEAELLERAVAWSRVGDAQREEEAVSSRIAAAQAAKAQAEARREAMQAEGDSCEEANRSEVRGRCAYVVIESVTNYLVLPFDLQCVCQVGGLSSLGYLGHIVRVLARYRPHCMLFQVDQLAGPHRGAEPLVRVPDVARCTDGGS